MSRKLDGDHYQAALRCYLPYISLFQTKEELQQRFKKGTARINKRDTTNNIFFTHFNYL